MNNHLSARERTAINLGLRRLGRERLLDEVKAITARPPAGTTWSKLKVPALADMFISAAAPERAQELAAEGLATQRSPSIGGPSWLYDAAEPFTAERCRNALRRLKEELPEEWDDVEIEFERPDLLGGIITAKYASFSPQPIGTRVEWAKAINTAMIILDFEDRISTVSARSEQDAFSIGAAWARAMHASQNPLPLSVSPTVDFPPLSPRAVQLLEAVYGHIAPAIQVVNIDRIWVKRSDPQAPVQEVASRGEASHVLLDDDVKRSLCRGDHITGLAFQVDWRYDLHDPAKSFTSHVTLWSQEGPMILTVTRGSQTLARTAVSYQLLRRSLAGASTDDGMTMLSEEIGRITT